MVDRPHPAPFRRIATAWVVVVLVSFAVVAGSVATARSQVATPPGSLPDGTYSGGIYFKMGGFLDAQGVYGMTSSSDAAGDATLTVLKASNSISGTWALEGTGAMGGSGTFNGRTATFAGSSTFTGSGVFSGTPLDGRLEGAHASKGTWTITASEGTFGPFRSGGPGSLDEPLTDLLSECSQLLAKWDSELGDKIEAEFNGQGVDLSITRLVAYLVLSDLGVTSDESWMADRLRELADRGNSTLGEARVGGGAMEAIGEGVKLLRDVEKLQADIAGLESDCPADKAFQNILTLIAQDGLDAVLEGFENDPTIEPNAWVLRQMIRLGDGTSAIGSGAQDTVRAGELNDRMEARANVAFDQALQSYANGDSAALNEALALVALAKQQGWEVETPEGVTGDDLVDQGPNVGIDDEQGG